MKMVVSRLSRKEAISKNKALHYNGHLNVNRKEKHQLLYYISSFTTLHSAESPTDLRRKQTNCCVLNSESTHYLIETHFMTTELGQRLKQIKSGKAAGTNIHHRTIGYRRAVCGIGAMPCNISGNELADKQEKLGSTTTQLHLSPNATVQDGIIERGCRPSTIQHQWLKNVYTRP